MKKQTYHVTAQLNATCTTELLNWPHLLNENMRNQPNTIAVKTAVHTLP